MADLISLTLNFKKQTPTEADWLAKPDAQHLRLRNVPDDLVVPEAVASLPIQSLAIDAEGDVLTIPEILFSLPIQTLQVWEGQMQEVIRFESVTDLWVVVKDPDADVVQLVEGMPQLEVLQLWGSHLKEGELSPSINRLTNLTKLELISCGLRTLPPLTLPKLETLRLRGLPMTTFPEGICSLTPTRTSSLKCVSMPHPGL